MWEALKCWIRWLAKTIYYYGIEAVEFVLDAIAAVINLLLGFLPQAALPDTNLDSGVIGMLNYIVPLDFIVGFSGVVMAAWIVYRIYQWALKWGKVDY